MHIFKRVVASIGLCAFMAVGTATLRELVIQLDRWFAPRGPFSRRAYLKEYGSTVNGLTFSICMATPPTVVASWLTWSFVSFASRPLRRREE